MPVEKLVELLIALAPLEQQGLALVTALVARWEGKGPVTTAEWNEILAKSSVSASDIMLDTLKANNVDPSSDLGKALLAATK